MHVDVLFFASLRETLGRASERCELPTGVDTAALLRAWLAARGLPWSDALAPGRNVRVAVDQVVAGGDAPLRDGAEVAFFPPVTGG